MSLNMIVTVKQVPDTHNVKEEAMKPDGTVNRAALPTVFNPEDLNALEEALKIKESFGGRVTVLTMGPPKAIEVLKDCLYRGADNAILLSDRQFAGADTLATSYALKCAIEKIGNYDLILCGRQAIDGDTAQVGPQIAEKLKINQLTCVSKILEIVDGSITVKRTLDGGFEKARSPFPVLLTVTSSANNPRPPSAKKVMIYKNINCLKDESYEETYIQSSTPKVLDHIKEWNVASVNAHPKNCGIEGSPTRVKKIENVVLSAADTKQIADTEHDVSHLVRELIQEHILG
ncbi:electron transfer flavoprotein subunit beta/FixA family protein [Acidobacteriota bacterium]